MGTEVEWIGPAGQKALHELLKDVGGESSL